MGMTYIYPPVTVSTLPPIGGATSANQVLEIAELQNIVTDLQNLSAQLSRQMSETLYFDYSAHNVDNAAWVEMIPATTDDSKSLTIFESGGYPMEIGVGASGLEARLFVIPAGGLNGQIDIPIPLGSRVSIRGLEAVTVNNGYIIANFLK